jgi:hypothetical protein
MMDDDGSTLRGLADYMRVGSLGLSDPSRRLRHPLLLRSTPSITDRSLNEDDVCV